MRKSAIAIALGSMFVASYAHAQSVELYGKAYPELIFISGSGATAVGATTATIAANASGSNSIVTRNEMQSGNSRFGVRGKEDLGGGLQAIFQFETAFGVDTPTAFGTRDSFVGLRGGFGEIKLGRMDTPFKKYGDDLSFLGISSGNIVSTSEIMRKTGFGGNSASSFHLRRQNATQYDSPEMSGFNFAIQYSTDETKTATRNAEVWSMGAKYEVGPWYFAIAHEKHDDLFGGSRNVRTSQSNFADQTVRAKDKSTQYTAKVKVGAHTFEVDVNQKQYTENATITGRFQSYKNQSVMLAMESRWSAKWRTAFHYLKANAGSCSLINAACSTSGLDGTQIAAGAAYYLSRRTMLFALVTKVTNGASARYNNSDLQTPSNGEDIRQVALGISHTF